MTTAKSQAKKVIWKVGCCVRETPDITDEPHTLPLTIFSDPLKIIMNHIQMIGQIMENIFRLRTTKTRRCFFFFWCKVGGQVSYLY